MCNWIVFRSLEAKFLKAGILSLLKTSIPAQFARTITSGSPQFRFLSGDGTIVPTEPS